MSPLLLVILLLLLLLNCRALKTAAAPAPAPWEKPACLPENRRPFEPPANDKKYRLTLPYGSCTDISARNFGCHGQRNEDCKIYKRFFKDDPKWRRGGFFVEMGGLDGHTFSNSLIFEQCLNWRGMLIEAHPTSYLKMIENRPCTWNVWGAVCPPDNDGITPSHMYMVHDFVEQAINFTAIEEHNAVQPGDATALRVKLTPCRSMSSILREARVTTIDFFSLDVEGAEFSVLESIDFNAVRINVLMVESAMLGNRNESSPNHYNSTLKMEKIDRLLTSPPANMVRLATRGALVPACQRKRKGLMVRVYDLHDSELYVHPDFRDDVCP